jgi:hypothetical protein
MPTTIQYLPAVFYLVVAAVCLVMARKSILARRIIPFHEAAAGKPWEDMEEPLKQVILTFTRTTGFGFLAVGLLIIATCSSRATSRSEVVPSPAQPASPAQDKPKNTSRYISWSELLRRTFGIEIVCTKMLCSPACAAFLVDRARHHRDDKLERCREHRASPCRVTRAVFKLCLREFVPESPRQLSGPQGQ